MDLDIRFYDGKVMTIENVRELTYAYEVPYYSVWFINETGRMQKITIMYDLVESIRMEKHHG